MEKSIRSFEDSVDEAFHLPEKDWKLYSPLTLAYIGDAAYEMVVRSIYVKRSNMQTQKLHQKVTACVKAQTQAKMIQLLLPELTEEDEIPSRIPKRKMQASTNIWKQPDLKR